MLTRLKIYDYEGLKFNEDIRHFETITTNGHITLSAQHVNIIAKITNCTSTITFENNTTKTCIILDALMFSTKTEIKVFTEFFSFTETINFDNIQNSSIKLQGELNLLNKSNEDLFNELNRKLQLSLNKIEARNTK